MLLATAAWSQLAIDTARGVVGEPVRVLLRLALDGGDSAGGSVRLDGTMRLSNPTVFYPERFIAPAGDSVTDFRLTPLRDSIYTFSATILRSAGADRPSGDTLLYLEGEALAGSDSVCAIGLGDLELNGGGLAPASGVVITRSIGPPLPYVRFAILEQNYPNPVRRGGSTIWPYRIDKVSIIRFHIYSLLGQELAVFDLGEQGIGPHTFTYTPEFTTPNGTYYVRLVTSTGSADKVMHIIY